MMKIRSKLVLLVLLFSAFTVSQPSLSAAVLGSDSLKIKGSIYHAKERIEEIKVNVYVGNDKIETIINEKSHKFKTYIPFNEIVTIEIISPNYHVKRLTIDTHVPKDEIGRMKYKFDMDLYTLKEMKEVNTSILDFPVGIIEYIDGKFKRNVKYTRQMKDEIARLLQEAYQSEEE